MNIFCKIKKNKYKETVFIFLSVILVIQFVFLPENVFAVINTWDFSNSHDYIFDDTKIDFLNGQVELKATSTPATWYNTGWGRRKAITIDNSGNSSTLTNYQVQILVTYDSDMQIGFDDIRFTDNDGVTLIDHWMETKTDSTSATFWVEIPSISALSSKIIYMYYGSSAVVSSVSNGSSTFNFFDDFNSSVLDTAKWNTYTDSLSFLWQGPVITSNTILFTAAHGNQGLASDGTNFFFGQNNGTGLNGTIYKYDYSGNEISSFVGPPHAADADIREDHNSIIFSTGGAEKPVVWELDKIGNHLRTWDFTGLDYDRGAMVAYKTTDTIYLATSDASNNIKIREVTINDDGTYLVGSTLWAQTSLGIPQGMEYKDSHIWLITDDNNGSIYELNLETDGSVTTVHKTCNITANEREGITWDGSNWYYGALDSKIRKIVFGSSDSFQVITGATSKKGYIYTKNSFSQSLILGAKSYGVGAYPVLIGLSDTGGTLPTDSTNMVGLGHFHGSDNFLYGRQRKGSVQSEQAYSGTTNWLSFQKYEIKWHDNKVEYLQNGNSLGSSTNNVVSTALYPMFGFQTTSYLAQASVGVDYMYLRQYTAQEPSVIFGGEQSVYVTDNPSVYGRIPQRFTLLSNFVETSTLNGGEIRYQLSNNDGDTWYWYNSGWATTTIGYPETNSASEINTNINTFNIGSGELLFKAYLHSDGSQLVKLDSVYISGVPLSPTIDIPTVISSSSIRWNFTDNSDDETGFQIYFDHGILATSSSVTNITYLDEIDLSENTQYSGRYATTYNGYGNSASSSTSTAVYTLADIPTNFSASANSNSITLSIDSFPNDTSGLSGYFFSRSDANSGWVQTNSWTDTNVSRGIIYNYSVKYRNGDGVETDSLTLSKTISGGRRVVIPNTTVADIVSTTTTVSSDISTTTEMAASSTELIVAPVLLPQIATSTIQIDPNDIYNLIKRLVDLSLIDGSKIDLFMSLISKPTSKYAFLNNLEYGQTHPDIKELQKFLNDNGYVISSFGVGSIGHETTYFGLKTKKALIKFQIENKISPSAGYFGIKTRNLINSY
jgi:hypothetical protein